MKSMNLFKMKVFAFNLTLIFLILLSGGADTADLAKGLTLYFSFDEDKGEEEVLNRYENDNNGILQGVPLPERVTGKSGKALSFKVGGWVEVSHSDTLDLTNAGTVAAWVSIKPSSSPRISNNGKKVFQRT